MSTSLVCSSSPTGYLCKMKAEEVVFQGLLPEIIVQIMVQIYIRLHCINRKTSICVNFQLDFQSKDRNTFSGYFVTILPYNLIFQTNHSNHRKISKMTPLTSLRQCGETAVLVGV